VTTLLGKKFRVFDIFVFHRLRWLTVTHFCAHVMPGWRTAFRSTQNGGN